MRRYHKKQKSLLTLLFIVEFFTVSVLPASAGIFGGGLFGTPSIPMPSASGFLSDMEKRYHLDTGSIQNQAETFNVGDAKKMTPEASLFFTPNDPKEGEKLSAKAFPVYFSNDEASMYYTWYLKRVGCNIAPYNSNNLEPSRNGISPTLFQRCDSDGDNRITVNDWKVEAAKIIVQNGYERPTQNVPDSDDDGYQARYGGNKNVNTKKDYCYINDSSSGTNYELVGNSFSSNGFSCPNGSNPVCIVNEQEVNPATDLTTTGGSTTTVDPDTGAVTVTPGDSATTGDNFSIGNSGRCSVSGTPVCSQSNSPLCSSGTPRCLSTDPADNSCGTALYTCSRRTGNEAGPTCRHLFPSIRGSISGNGDFGAPEESFWGTDPTDPDTADNGNKDEANVVGLGLSTFNWNYTAGDQVGVAVEGISMIATKHDDASAMIMWALSKNDCKLPSDVIGSYTENIKGYAVTIPTARFDIDTCLEKNLVDPAKGGQATRLEVSVTASPDNPINDPGLDQGGDTVEVQATVDNAAKDLSTLAYAWKVQISNNSGFTPGTTAEVNEELSTSPFRGLGLLSKTKGNALDNVRMKLNIPTQLMNTYLDSTGASYLKFKVDVSENFSNGTVAGTARKGRGEVIVKFISTNQTISAYRVESNADSITPAQRTLGATTQVNLLTNTPICDGSLSPLDRSVCRVIKDEIIGLRVNSEGLSGFRWTINGTPLNCTKRVSESCSNTEQGNINFFPVTGNPGDTYTVSVTANEISKPAVGSVPATVGKTVNLSRAFSVVEPRVMIVAKKDDPIVGPKYLGQYTDLSAVPATNCPNGLCDDFSETVFQASSGSDIHLQALFVPSDIRGATSGMVITKEWAVDGQAWTEINPAEQEISFQDTAKQAPDVYTVNLVVKAVQKDSIRKALVDIWGVSQFSSPELNFSATVQVELQDPTLALGPLSGPRKFYAAIASYIPASVMFTFRIFLSVVLTLFALSFLHALLEERRIRAFVENFSRQK